MLLILGWCYTGSTYLPTQHDVFKADVLQICGNPELMDRDANRRYLLAKTQHRIGGFGKFPGDLPGKFIGWSNLFTRESELIMVKISCIQHWDWLVSLFTVKLDSNLLIQFFV